MAGGVATSLRAGVRNEVARVRRNGRASVLWSLRLTVVAVAAYALATAFFPGTKPLLAPLTAMLVVQVTPISLLASGVDRVVAVVAGVGLATGFAAVVPLRWWSLGLLILVSITIGQFLRLRDNLVEVAISAMLVLGVGVLGAEAAAWQRITETLVGAAVAVVMNLLLPPKVPSADAGDAIDGLADRLSTLLTRVADELEEADADRLRPAAVTWLDDGRRITHDIPEVGAALIRAEESRRLNVRAAGTPHVEPGLRQGLEALEHSATSIRGLMRAFADAVGSVPDLGPEAALAPGLAGDLRAMATAVDVFGELVRHEATGRAQVGIEDVNRLRDALAALQDRRQRIDDVLTGQEISPEARELLHVMRTTVDRVGRELAVDERVRRQLRLLPARRGPRLPRRRPHAQPPIGPDDETQVLPAQPDA